HLPSRDAIGWSRYMNQSMHLTSRGWAYLLVGLLIVVAVAAGVAAPGLLQGQKPAGSSPTVEQPKSEAELAPTSLTAGQYKSLGIHSEPAKTLPVQQSLKLHGFVTARPGCEVLVTAPVAGYVRAPAAAEDFPITGRTARAGQIMLLLEPVLSPVDRSTLSSTLVQLQTLRRGYEGEVAKARDSVSAAKSEHKRLTELVASKLHGEQNLEAAPL